MSEHIKIASLSDASSQTLSLFYTPLFVESRAVLCILENNKQIKIWQDLLELWQKELKITKKKILTWPNGQEAPFEVLLNLHRLKDSIILTTLENLDLPIANWSKLQEQKITLQLGSKYSLYQLSKDLVHLGLERQSQVMNHGTFAIRGSVLDIFQYDKIYRLNFEQDTIENLLCFDPEKIYQEHQISEAEIWPQQSIHKEKILNSLPPSVLLVSEMIEATNNTPNPRITFDALAQNKFITETLNKISTNTHNLTDFIKKQKGVKIIWLSKNKTLAQKMLTDLDLESTIYDWQHALAWPQAIWSPEANIILINDSLFFTEDTDTSRVQKEFRASFDIGDLVVHRDHGLARLKEMTTMSIDGQEREYFVLAYAENDTLFVPADLADKLEKYIGPSNPKIHRLSVGNTWPQTLRKIKAQTWELANQLLMIEATRKLQHSPKLLAKNLEKNIAQDFPYQLTASQSNAITAALHDLEQNFPSDRLVCGDVGFGKTEVAIRAAARVAANGYQTALLCPTTLLAQQHYDNFAERFNKYGINVVLLTRWQSEAEIAKNILAIKNGTADIIIGTHRLLSRDIQIPRLQLLIIDEEQNFGVKDKEKLKKHQANIHILTLTATPIPRTLNMALSMIKDISLINDPISNRRDIVTKVTPEDKKIIKEAIELELKRQGQVYYLYNQVETIDLALKQLKKIIPQARIAIAHGQMEDQKLAEVMHAFDTGQVDVLLCSTIIANGLDIPKANTLIVHQAHRFGLSQLHQLRGRIGRSDRQAYAYFMYNSEKLPKLASQRLGFLKQATHLGEGFKIANKDLELRGVGQILGKAQSGKVKSIGLGLYQQLISETIQEIKGQPVKYWRDIEIKLPLDLSLPPDFNKSLAEKIIFYQKISQEKNLENIEKNIHHAKHENIANLWSLQKIKVLSQEKNISAINHYKTSSGQNLAINFFEQPNFSNILSLQEKNSAWQYNNLQLKIKIDYLGKNILPALEQAIKNL